MSDIENTLHGQLEQIAKDLGYENKVISINLIPSTGANYTSHLYRATITATEQNDLNLFIKVAAIGEKMRNISPNKIYVTEAYFYNELLKNYRKLEDEFHIDENDRLATPKFYGYNDEFLKETLILENLVEQNFKEADRFKAMTPEYAFKGGRQLAKFHALSFALAKHYPDEFENTKQVIQCQISKKPLLDFVKNIIGNVVEAVNENNKVMVSKFIENILNKASIDPSVKLDKPVIAHGDYRSSNLMYKQTNNGLQIKILDFQTIHHGCVVSDLLYFILNGADKNFLENSFKATVDNYYSELSNALRKFNVDPEEAYSREDFERELEQNLPISLILGFCTLLIVTVEEDKAPKANEELDLKDFAVKPNDIYKERVNGIIEFFIKQGVFRN